jgi:phospholipid/cholesterol/gamma-HCH transport system substrate-binding protein
LLYFNFNYLPIPVNPILAPAFDPKNVVYTEQRLAPGGEGPKPTAPELPPSVSAYAGLPGDTPDWPPPPPPPGRIPEAAMPEPPPASVPPEPPPAPANVPDMLLPAERPQP